MAVAGGVVVLAVGCLVVIVGIGRAADPRQPPAADGDDPIRYRVEVVAAHPHDERAFTQGLEVVGGNLVESTGGYGESTLRLVEPDTGEVVRAVPLRPDEFGEGATVVDDEVWQLTWLAGQVIVYGFDDFAERRRFTYPGEGWGLCAGSEGLVMSDGSSRLQIRDRETFELLDTIEVVRDGQPVEGLNELECLDDGVVWANLYRTTDLVAITVDDGQVVGSVDVAELVPAGFAGHRENVANGIAHDPDTGRFWLTGKRWPVVYEVELVPE